MNTYSFLADVVVVAHLGYVLFVILGLVAILAGYLLHWNWVRNIWFRSIHFTMIAVVVIEALLSITCPLTTLENYLRAEAGQVVRSGSFVGQMAQDILFLDFSPRFFMIAYCVFGSVVLLTLVLVPPKFRRENAQP